MTTRPVRRSINSTYDSRETGDRYHVTTWVGNTVVDFQKRMPDPFVRHTVHVGWRDLLRGLLRRRLDVVVLVGADMALVDDVLELDANTLIPNSTRREEFNAGLGQAMVRACKEAEAASGEVAVSTQGEADDHRPEDRGELREGRGKHPTYRLLGVPRLGR